VNWLGWLTVAGYVALIGYVVYHMLNEPWDEL